MEKNHKRVIVVNRSFWPDIEATGQFLTELCEALALRYDVTVIAGRSYYKTDEKFKPLRLYIREAHNGVNIIRVKHTRFWKGNLLGRFANWITYGLLSFGRLFFLKADMIIVCTDPPFMAPLMAVHRFFRSTPFIYNCRDLYPDVALALKRLNEGVVSRTFNYLNKKAFLSARLVVPLGVSMEKRIAAKGVPKNKIKCIPDWVDTSLVKPIPKDENYLLKKFGLEGKFIILYSGNIGLSQDFGFILKALASIRAAKTFSLVIIGEGAGKKALRSQASSSGLTDVLFLPYQPVNELSFSLSMGDIHLIPLVKGMAGAIVPSKLYGIMAAGRPYLAVADKESEPAQIARLNGCGLWAEPEDVGSIARAAEWAIDNSAKLGSMGKIGRQIAEDVFDKKIVINEWFEMLDRAFMA